MSRITAILDANVLYPAPLRDLLLQLAVSDLYRARWTGDIHSEWIEALLRREPTRERTALERTRDLMDLATRDSLIDDYRGLIPSLALPDAGDRHVLAAAIVGRCDCIVTKNLAHFPLKSLEPFGIDVQHPDQFLLDLLNRAPGLFCASARTVRARLKNPPYEAEAYLATLKQVGLVATAGELRGFIELL